ncbi:MULTISPECIES: DUF3899 domain-containing protein [Sporolactobacillus]|uniref:DUF3899 domain-containing protein n=1 Tax=Sporolactobacillus nakayamae TaxID=269670 RepID=A0A1I2R6G7_9BACL|nr:DUF3899 domain-containing protein [Sporolactobacillus nakayamae]SFG36335.1 protein of unknown function [Sporolactobacillus nakayamae]
MNLFKTNVRFLFMFIFLIEITIALLLLWLLHAPFSLLVFINYLSVVSLLFFNLGLIIFIIQGGFFDGAAYSFKRFVRATRKKALQEEDAEAPLEEYNRRDGKRALITWPLIVDSILLFLCSILLTWFI